MRAIGLDIIYTAVLNDEEQSILSILCGKNVPLPARLEACEFIVEEIKKGIAKQEELDAQAKLEDPDAVIETEDNPEATLGEALEVPVEDHV